jgi:hypothetical protein
MSSQLIGLFGVAGLLLLIFARVPVGVALGMVGIAGYAALDGWQRAFLVLGRTPFDLASSYKSGRIVWFVGTLIFGPITAIIYAFVLGGERKLARPTAG